MRIIGWSSDVCSSDLGLEIGYRARCDWLQLLQQPVCLLRGGVCLALRYLLVDVLLGDFTKGVGGLEYGDQLLMLAFCKRVGRSEEHTSELQSLMRISYAVFCLKKKKKKDIHHNHRISHRATSKTHTIKQNILQT